MQLSIGIRAAGIGELTGCVWQFGRLGNEALVGPIVYVDVLRKDQTFGCDLRMVGAESSVQR